MYIKIKEIIKLLLIVCAGGVLGSILLILVYSLPMDKIFYNFSTGVEGMERNTGWYQFVFDYDASTIDSYTEALMIKAAATPMPPTGENILQYALRGYTLNEENAKHGLHFYEYEWDGKTYKCDSYERYWHGYLVLLKPLMCFFSFHDIIFLNIAMQMFIMFLILIAIIKNGADRLIIPFICLWLLSLQSVIMFGIDYAACFYIYAIAVLCLLVNRKIQEKYICFFMVIGMCTSYMDFLTWPLITLGVPLAVFVYLGQKEERQYIVRRTIYATIIWGFGYIGQWGMKWIIATLCLRENIFGNAVAEIGLRSAMGKAGATNEEFAYFQVIGRNIGVFLKKPYVLLFIIIFGYLLYLAKHSRSFQIKKLFPYIVVCALPFGWYALTKNHSYIHYWMTWRILCISFFSLICGGIACTEKKNNVGECYAK